jgi:hypothetical protein
MPSTLNVNSLTAVHAASGGISMCFPDVCKTPAPPAPPIPIPYPNISQSSDTADGSSTVKVDGNPIMLKNSNFKMSTGDEAGSLFGIMSNKNKGKAYPANASFDVKADGQNVFRLTDPMKANCGSDPMNGAVPAEAQGPNPVIPNKSPECQEVQKKKDKQEQAGTSWGKSGIIAKHHATIQQVTDDKKMVVYFRKTKRQCARWISDEHMPKPHSCLSGTTIRKKHLPLVKNWLDRHAAKLAPTEISPHYKSVQKWTGIIGLKVRSDEIKPLKGRGSQIGNTYTGKWMTGDYDVFQVLKGLGECEKVSGSSFAGLKRAINKGLSWDAIQHGPQAQWKPKRDEIDEGLKLFNMNVEVNAALKNNDLSKSVEFAKGRDEMDVIDSPLTVVCGKTIVALEGKEDVADSLKCKGCGK